MTNKVISKEEAKQLKPYLAYMDLVNVREDRRFLVKNLLYRNMLLGNISRTLVDELRVNFIKENPGVELPEILKSVN